MANGKEARQSSLLYEIARFFGVDQNTIAVVPLTNQ